MRIQLPAIIAEYIRNIDSVPLVPFKNSLWFSITEKEKAALCEYVAALDATPRAEWEAMPDKEKWEIACAINDAERIIRNCIIRKEG